MISRLVLLVLAVSGVAGHERNAGELPVCSNRRINEVVRRVGCTVGDARCWTRGGGFCLDHVEGRIAAGGRGAAVRLEPIEPADVKSGDVAVFVLRAHYAYVERVVRDESGGPVTVDVSEYNFGTCWVDKETMVTDRYKVVSWRRGLPVAQVDGGFLRPRVH